MKGKKKQGRRKRKEVKKKGYQADILQKLKQFYLRNKIGI